MDEVRVRSHVLAVSARLAVAACMLVASLTLVACSGSAGDTTSGSPSSEVESSVESQLAQAVAQLYPGFEIVEYLGNEGGIEYVAARRDTTPEFVAKLGFMKGRDWTESVTIDGTQWSTNGFLGEAASDASLLTGPLQKQALESIAVDAGLVGGSDGRYIHEIRVVSNVEIIAFVWETEDEYSMYQYKLDMSQVPQRFVLEYKAESR